MTADGSVGELLDALAGAVADLSPGGERLVAAVRAAAPDPGTPVDADVCARLTAAGRAESRSFGLGYDLAPEGPASDVRLRAGSVSRVDRGADGVATVVLDALDDLAHAAPYIDAAFALARGCGGLLLDLRANSGGPGGGDPATAALVIGWLLGGARVQLAALVTAAGERPLWTPGLRSDRELAAVPVAVLTSGRTRAAAEGLAHHLRARRRATLVGEPTGGAADLVTPVALTGRVRGLIPSGRLVDARTGESWEGTGVPPHLACSAADAPARARAWLAAPAPAPGGVAE